MPSSNTPWWSQRYARMLTVDPAFAGEVDGLAEEQVDLLERVLSLQPAARVLDLGCGGGRHSILLAERGHRVVGLDLSAEVLALARERWEQRHPGAPGPEWVQADMRDPAVEGRFDACIAMDSAFGVFDDDAEHLQVLGAIFEHLAEDGVLVLELMNPYFWANHASTMHYPPGALAADVHLVRTYRFDADRGRVEDLVTVFRPGGDAEVLPAQTLRSWTPPEIRALVLAAGFRDVAVYGSDGWRTPAEPRPLDPVRSAFMWVVARA